MTDIPEISLDEFLSDDILAAFAEGSANALEDGTYRWVIKSIETKSGQAGGAVWKRIIFRGVNADNGSPMVRERMLTKHNGTINTVALTMLGEQMAKAGIRKNLKEILTDSSGLPVVNMVVSTRVGSDNVPRQDWAIAACADQSIVECPF